MQTTDLLEAYVARERRKAFQWGAGNGDCLLFPLGWAELNGRRSSTQWRGLYADEAGAREALERFGGAIAAVCDVLGPPRCGRGSERGDVGLLEIDGWHLGMICTGRMWVCRAGEGGLRLMRCRPGFTWQMTPARG